jgi:hypothetical protein
MEAGVFVFRLPLGYCGHYSSNWPASPAKRLVKSYNSSLQRGHCTVSLKSRTESP